MRFRRTGLAGTKKTKVSFDKAAVATETKETAPPIDEDSDTHLFPTFYPPIPRASEGLQRTILDLVTSTVPPPATDPTDNDTKQTTANKK